MMTYQRICPHCQADLEEVGLAEIKTGVTTWTIWHCTNGRWDLVDEENGNEEHWHMECLGCHCRLPDGIAEANLQHMERHWLG